MKTIFLVLLQLAIVSTVSTAWGQCVLNLRVNDSPPYYYLENNTYKGLFVEQARSIASQVGCEVNTIKAPWARSLRMLEQGQLDFMGNMSITPERQKFLRFLGPHHYEKIVLVVAENSNYEINSHADLLKVPGFIGVEREAYYGPEFQELLKLPEAQDKWIWFTGEDPFSLNERVRLGRLAGFIDVYKPRYKTKGLKYHPFIINSAPVYFGLSKKSVNEELFQKLEKALQNGGEEKFEQLSSKYE